MKSNLSARRQGGFTLVEILVTVVLISVGLLGIAALQLQTLRGNQEAYVRSQASVLSADILDRMRANASAFRAGGYDAGYNGTGDTSTRAGQDLAEWQTTINRTLPGGVEVAAGRVERVAATQIVTITIRWRERATGDGTANGGDREFRVRSEI
ncbi:MAG: type IV pilus modification protein PilV [Steroidobacter sp.]